MLITVTLCIPTNTNVKDYNNKLDQALLQLDIDTVRMETTIVPNNPH